MCCRWVCVRVCVTCPLLASCATRASSSLRSDFSPTYCSIYYFDFHWCLFFFWRISTARNCLANFPNARKKKFDQNNGCARTVVSDLFAKKCTRCFPFSCFSFLLFSLFLVHPLHTDGFEGGWGDNREGNQKHVRPIHVPQFTPRTKELTWDRRAVAIYRIRQSPQCPTCPD